MTTGSEFPPPSELAELRELFADHLVHGTTVKVLHAEVGPDDYEGRSTLTYPDPGDVDPTPGRVMPNTGRELRGDQWVQVTTWRARLPLDAEVTHGDRLVDTTTGGMFEVTSVAEHGSHLGVLYLDCNLIRVDGSVL